MSHLNHKKLAPPPGRNLPKDFKVALATAISIAVGHALWVANYLGYRDGYHYWSQFQSVVEYHGNVYYETLHVFTAIALLVNVLGLSLRRPVGFIVSTISLIFVEVVFLWWYFDSVRWLSVYGAERFVALPHVWMFKQATWWNMVVLSVASVLLLWQLRTLPRLYCLGKESLDGTN